jgi:hypothetical protein
MSPFPGQLWISGFQTLWMSVGNIENWLSMNLADQRYRIANWDEFFFSRI